MRYLFLFSRSKILYQRRGRNFCFVSKAAAPQGREGHSAAKPQECVGPCGAAAIPKGDCIARAIVFFRYAAWLNRFLARLNALALWCAMDHAIAVLNGSAKLLARLEGKPQFDEVSAKKATDVLVALKPVVLTDDDAARLLDLLEATRFAEDDRKRIEARIIEVELGSSKADTKMRETKKQDFDNLRNYLPKSLWERLSGPDGSEKLFTHLRALGLYEPSEKSMQMATILLLLATEGAERTLSMQPREKNTFMKLARKWWSATDVAPYSDMGDKNSRSSVQRG